ncbi:IS1595 family transposase [Sinomicrobium oceani]|uniref:IS1595 family transposase n=1 Tax=Sinomicrobium oceani TaxID=1150368 RepID=UPI00227BE65E|nr:IS1595 family transposase [Sinomicrobium oceani]
MELSELRKKILSLFTEEREHLWEISQSLGDRLPKAQAFRLRFLENKMGEYLHYDHGKPVRFHKNKDSQCYKCRSYGRNFTEYTGTWMSRLHGKNKIDKYLKLMVRKKGHDKIKETLEVNKKTALDWWHKVLSSLIDTNKDDFIGITESDETFFLDSEKDNGDISRKPGKRCGTSNKKGDNDRHVAVIVKRDRKFSMDMIVATIGRMKKTGIERVIGGCIKKDRDVLCKDVHVSYKVFAMDYKCTKGAIKQRAKQSIYHIQYMNSVHNKVKK